MYLEIPTFPPRRGNNFGPCIVDGSRGIGAAFRDKIKMLGMGTLGIANSVGIEVMGEGCFVGEKPKVFQKGGVHAPTAF
jgi:hypothetical protein